MLGLLDVHASQASGGEILWNGQPVADPASFFVPPRSAYTPQVPLLFSESLKDNILMGLPEQSVDLDEALWLAVLEPDLAEFPDGLDTLLGAKGVRLSGGQRQRAAAARMYVRDPDFLVFDDLSSALDVETEELLWRRTDRLRERGVTCLVVSHRRPALLRADQIVVLAAGKVAATGSLEDLLRTCEEVQRLWHGAPGLSERHEPQA
jgi:ATP-binding cassette subfamily B protein